MLPLLVQTTSCEQPTRKHMLLEITTTKNAKKVVVGGVFRNNKKKTASRLTRRNGSYGPHKIHIYSVQRRCFAFQTLIPSCHLGTSPQGRSPDRISFRNRICCRALAETLPKRHEAFPMSCYAIMQQQQSSQFRAKARSEQAPKVFTRLFYASFIRKRKQLWVLTKGE